LRVDIDAAVAAVRTAPIESLARPALEEVVASLRSIRSWCDAVEVRVARRSREVDETPERMLADKGHRPPRQARQAAARESACTAMPAFEQALAEGEVSTGHVDGLAAAIRDLDDAARETFGSYESELLGAARRQSVAEFQRAAGALARHIIGQQNGGSDEARLRALRERSNVKHWVNDTTGMHHTHLELDPVRDETLWTAVRAQLAKLRQRDGNQLTPFAQLEVDAFVTAVQSGGDAGVPEVAVHIDWRTLTDGLHDASLCETSAGVRMPVSTVRRLCCNAKIIPIVLGSDGEVLDVGREVRLPNRAQRRALRAKHRRCAYPDCTVPFDACRIHHVVWWCRGGSTDLANLLPLCERHHHLVHEGGWGLSMTADRVVTWARPDGEVFHRGPVGDRGPIHFVEPRARSAPVAVA
jgi:hypothetical protein